jgi:hypothetical protein
MNVASKLSGLGLSLAFTALAGCTGIVSSSNSSSGGNNGPPATTGPGGVTNPAGGTGPVVQSCDQPSAPTAAPLRRLTQFEYNNTLRDLAKAPAVELPAEDIGNLFANDVATQSVPPSLVKAYNESAATVAASLTAADRIASLAPCASAPGSDESGCARTVVAAFAPRAYRRPLANEEADGLVQLFQTVRMSGQTFASSLAAVIEAVLQAPDFLYRPEFGVPAENRADVRRLTDSEMAVRLSYLFWGSQPDEELAQTASAGQLHTPEQIKAAATRLLADVKSRDVVRYFFDFLLPIQGLAALQRKPETYPKFNSTIGELMRTEAETFLLKEVYEGSGTWPGILTAPYTYVNADLAAYYGFPGVTGSNFQKVPVDGVTRGGLLSLGGVAAGPVHSNKTNPVTRGSLVVKKLMCQVIPLPPPDLAAMIKPPPDDSAPTARQRYEMHSASPTCHVCHVNMDPVGFALEKIDAVGQVRDQENGVTIDATGSSPLLGDFNGPVELGQRVAASEVTQACFAKRWVDFGYGRTTDDANCSLARVKEQFKAANYDIQQLLLNLTQTDDFLYLPAVQQ